MKLSRQINLVLLIVVVVFVGLGVVVNQWYVSSQAKKRALTRTRTLIAASRADTSEILANMILEQNEGVSLYLDRMRLRDSLDGSDIVTSRQYDIETRGLRCMQEFANEGVCVINQGSRYALYNKLRYGSSDFGYLKKVYTTESESVFTKGQLLQLALVLIPLLAALFVALSQTLNAIVVKPLRDICEKIQPLGSGNFDIRLAFQRAEELKTLSQKICTIARELKAYQDERARNSSLVSIGRTTSMIAHDIRKPFANMRALLDVLPEKKDDDVFVRYAVSQVRDSVRRAESMMNDILEYSRDARTEAEDVCVSAMMSSALGDVFKVATHVDVTVTYALSHRRCVRADEVQIARAITNVVDNAVSAMNGRGTITVATRDVERDGRRWVEVVVGNDGLPIAAEDLEHLFEPFFTKGKKGGSGLGLAICHKIVTANGGTIRVQSAPGRTDFIFTLPASELPETIDEGQLIHHSREIRELMPVEPAGRSMSEDVAAFIELHQGRDGRSCLLIVDDEPLFRETIRALIQRIPEARDRLQVVEAGGAEEALALFEAREFDYVITDIEMGRFKMDGYDFAKTVLDQHEHVLVMIHSNKRIHGKDVGLVGRGRFQGCLPKPMDEEELMHFLAGRIFEQPEKRPSTVGANVVQRAAKQLLVVNDEEFMRMALRCQLRRLGDVQVHEAGGVSEAMRILKTNAIDVVLADINLGSDGDGYDVLQGVKQHASGTRVFMMSGMEKSDAWPRAEALGADGYIQIPYEEEVLRTVLNPS